MDHHLPIQHPGTPSIRSQRCPNPQCTLSRSQDAKSAAGNGVILHGQKRKRFKCRMCKKTWSALRNSPLHGLRTDAGKIQKVIQLMQRGISIRKIAQTVGVSKNTVLRWKKRLKNYNYEDFFSPPT